VLLICCIDRSINTAAQAVDIVETAIAHRRPEVVGIGPRRRGARRAARHLRRSLCACRRAGLHRTAHCCEDNQTLVEAPPTNYLICRDVLRCERIDHGYNMLASDSSWPKRGATGSISRPAPGPAWWPTGPSARCASGAWSRRAERHHQHRRPGDVRDQPRHGFRTLFEANGWGPDMARKFSLNSVEASWLKPAEKTALRLAFRKEIAALDKEFGYEVEALTV
jgi:adenosine deaminase